MKSSFHHSKMVVGMEAGSLRTDFRPSHLPETYGAHAQGTTLMITSALPGFLPVRSDFQSHIERLEEVLAC